MQRSFSSWSSCGAWCGGRSACCGVTTSSTWPASMLWCSVKSSRYPRTPRLGLSFCVPLSSEAYPGCPCLCPCRTSLCAPRRSPSSCRPLSVPFLLSLTREVRILNLLCVPGEFVLLPSQPSNGPGAVGHPAAISWGQWGDWRSWGSCGVKAATPSWHPPARCIQTSTPWIRTSQSAQTT